MSKPRTRRLVGTFTTEVDGQELVKLPRKRSRERDEYQAAKQASEPPTGGQHGDEPAEPTGGQGAAAEPEYGPGLDLTELRPLSNEEIEHELRCLAGGALKLMRRLATGQKPPRGAQTLFMAASWIVKEARQTPKPATEDEKARAAKLAQARKVFGSAPAALNTELQQRTRAERNEQH